MWYHSLRISLKRQISRVKFRVGRSISTVSGERCIVRTSILARYMMCAPCVFWFQKFVIVIRCSVLCMVLGVISHTSLMTISRHLNRTAIARCIPLFSVQGHRRWRSRFVPLQCMTKPNWVYVPITSIKVQILALARMAMKRRSLGYVRYLSGMRTWVIPKPLARCCTLM